MICNNWRLISHCLPLVCELIILHSHILILHLWHCISKIIGLSVWLLIIDKIFIWYILSSSPEMRWIFIFPWRFILIFQLKILPFMMVIEKLRTIKSVTIVLVIMILTTIGPISGLIWLPLLVVGCIILLYLTVITIRINIGIHLFNTVVRNICSHSIIAFLESIIIHQSLPFSKCTSFLM